MKRSSMIARFEAPPRNVPTDFVVDGPLLGNGDVGVALSGPPEALTFHVGKNDAWTRDACKLRGGPRVLTVGGLRLEAPALRGADYAVEQDIACAELRARFSRPEATLELAAWMPRERNLLVCELRNRGAAPLELAARLWAGPPQSDRPDREAGQVTVGHTGCWLTPCIDRFCGELQSVRVYDTALSEQEMAAACDGEGPAPLHEFAPLATDDDPLPLACQLPALSGGGVAFCARVRPSPDPGLRARRKAAQPHGYTFHYGADVQFLLAKSGVFSLRLVDGQPTLTVGRLTAAADCRLTPGEWTWLGATLDGRTFAFYVDGKRVATVLPDRVTEGADDRCLWNLRELDPDLEQGVSVAMAAACQEGAYRIGPGGLALTLAPGGSCRLLTAVVSNRDDADPGGAARRLAADSTADQIAGWRVAHEGWWREYWDRSSVDVGDDLIHRYYYGAYYLLGCCCGDAAKVPPGLFGNWITTDTPAWRGDFHLNYNYQSPWWGAFSGNRAALADAYEQPLLDFLPAARENARRAGHAGLLYPVGIGPWGIPADPVLWGQKSNAAYAAVNMVMRWDATRDPAYLREKAYPFVREVGEYWESALVDEGGRYVIQNDSIHEGSGDDMNSILSLGLVRMVFAFLLEASEALGCDADRRGNWARILERMSAYPILERQGRRVFRLSERGMAWCDGGSKALAHVFPAGRIGLGSPAELLEIARETVRQKGVWDDYNAFSTFYMQVARVGYAPAILLEKLREQLCGRRALPNLYLFYGGGGIESCGGITGTINEMLMQSHEGIIRLFPCWPRDRDASFRDLRARGAFLVSATLRGGEIAKVTVRSEVGGICRLANPFPATAPVVVREARRRAPVREVAAADVIEWPTKPGRRYSIVGPRELTTRS